MGMTKENATTLIRIFPTTHKKLKIECAKQGLTLAELIEKLAKKLSPET